MLLFLFNSFYLLNRNLLIIYLLICIILCNFIYFNNDPILSFQIPFGIINLLVVIQTIILYKKINKYGYLIRNVIIFYGFGFILWIIDQKYCNSVREYYFHAWWHILTGIGGYYWIQFIYLTKLTNNKNILPYYD